MVEVLQLPDTYEKAKKYSVILQRHLTLLRQEEHEKGTLTLSVAVNESAVTSKGAAHPADDM